MKVGKPIGAKTYAKDGNSTKDLIIFFGPKDGTFHGPVMYGHMPLGTAAPSVKPCPIFVQIPSFRNIQKAIKTHVYLNIQIQGLVYF